MFANPAGIVYGTVVVAALLDAESAVAESYADTIGAVLVAMVLYWLAHAYADFVGQRLRQRETIRATDLARALWRELAVLAGAGVPLLVLVLTDLAGGSLNTAVSTGIYASAAMLLLIELAAGLRAGLSGAALLVQSMFGALLGALVIALKLILH